MMPKPGVRAPQKPQPKPSPAQRVGNVTNQMAQRTGAKPMPSRNGGGIASVTAKPPAPGPQASTPMPPTPQPPAWQQLAAAGIGGQGSAAANRAALASLPQAQAEVLNAQPTLKGPPMPMNRPARPGMIQGGAAMGAQGPIDNIGGGGQGMPPQMQSGGGVMPMGANLPPQVLQALQSGNFGGMPGQSFPGGTFGELPAQLQGMQPPVQQTQGLGGPGSDVGFQSGGGLQAPPMARGRGGMQNAPAALDAYFAPQQVGRGFNY